eukprot:gene9611-biopygen4004
MLGNGCLRFFNVKGCSGFQAETAAAPSPGWNARSDGRRTTNSSVSSDGLARSSLMQVVPKTRQLGDFINDCAVCSAADAAAPIAAGRR